RAAVSRNASRGSRGAADGCRLPSDSALLSGLRRAALGGRRRRRLLLHGVQERPPARARDRRAAAGSGLVPRRAGQGRLPPLAVLAAALGRPLAQPEGAT